MDGSVSKCSGLHQQSCFWIGHFSPLPSYTKHTLLHSPRRLFQCAKDLIILGYSLINLLLTWLRKFPQLQQHQSFSIYCPQEANVVPISIAFWENCRYTLFQTTKNRANSLWLPRWHYGNEISTVWLLTFVKWHNGKWWVYMRPYYHSLKFCWRMKPSYANQEQGEDKVFFLIPLIKI